MLSSSRCDPHGSEAKNASSSTVSEGMIQLLSSSGQSRTMRRTISVKEGLSLMTCAYARKAALLVLEGIYASTHIPQVIEVPLGALVVVRADRHWLKISLRGRVAFQAVYCSPAVDANGSAEDLINTLNLHLHRNASYAASAASASNMKQTHRRHVCHSANKPWWHQD